jgi:hypothetical protein
MSAVIKDVYAVMTPSERAKLIISSDPAYDPEPKYRLTTEYDPVEGTRKSKKVPLDTSVLGCISLEEFTPWFCLDLLASAGYPRVADRISNGTQDWPQPSYRNLIYALLLVPEEGDDIVVAKQGTYRTMCGGQMVHYTSLSPTTNPRFYNSGEIEPVDHAPQNGSYYELPLDECFRENAIGILTVTIDTESHNEHLDAVWQAILDDDDSTTWCRNEYPSVAHEGQSAVSYIIHRLDQGGHDEYSEGDSGNYYDEYPRCADCGYEMEWTDECDAWQCPECGCDECDTSVSTEDEHIDNGRYDDYRRNWMAGVPQWYGFERMIQEGTSDGSMVSYYAGLMLDRNTVTAACWRIKRFGNLSEIQRECRVPFPSLSIRHSGKDGDFDLRMVEEIMSALGCLHTENNADGDDWCDKVAGFHDGTTHLKYPVYISCNVGTGSHATLNVMKVLLENDEYLRERFNCTVAQPEDIATNPKENHHYIDSMVLLPMQGGKQ